MIPWLSLPFFGEAAYYKTIHNSRFVSTLKLFIKKSLLRLL
ncbi:hypothetical protein HMPREF9554_02286 [Treponema phagedenis F0421]|nr:hypothetical protein HMPREF9554_02286 [Treponema phagedenis F0421]